MLVTRRHPRGRRPGSAGYRWQHGDLVGVGDRLVGLGRLAVAPHLGRRQHLGEPLAVACPSLVEHVTDGPAGDDVTTGAGRFAGCREQTERGHGCRVPAGRLPLPSRGSSARDHRGLFRRPSTAWLPFVGMTRMLLVRHGQSEWNALGRWQGQADVPLSELGRRQARVAASAIGTVDIIVASDLERAAHTAAIIGETIGVGPVMIEPLLRERDAGEWSGLTRKEIDAGWPGYVDDHKRPPGFEPEEAFLERTHAGLVRVHAEYEGADVLVVTHGGVIYAFEREAGLPFQRLPNLGARQITHRGDGIDLGERLDLVADEDADDPRPVRGSSGSARRPGGPAESLRNAALRAQAGPEADIDPTTTSTPTPITTRPTRQRRRRGDLMRGPARRDRPQHPPAQDRAGRAHRRGDPVHVPARMSDREEQYSWCPSR